MPLYFAYGANMDREAMASRCPRSHPLGRARLARHRLFLMADGFASVAPEPKSFVHGVLWDLASSDVAPLDRFEEVGRGRYRKIVQPVLREPFGAARALIYVGVEGLKGPHLPGYMQGVVAAARDWELPPAYVAYLEALAEPARRTQS